MNRTHVVCCVTGAILIVAAACSESLPTAPSELAEGIVLYEHANFTGASAHLAASIRDLEDFDGPCEHEYSSGNGTTTVSKDWNDCVSSIRVAPGWRVQVYRDDDFRGQSLDTAQDVPNLQLVPGSCDHDGLNDCVTSVRITRP